MEAADLEISIHRRDLANFAIGLRYSQPGDSNDTRLLPDDLAPIQFDIAMLSELILDTDAYGRQLSSFLFADTKVKQAFLLAYSNAQSSETPLRVRLFIGASALELHTLRWETLRHPEDDIPLFQGEQVYFSRYLSSADWRPMRLRSRRQSRALVVIANPHGLEAYAVERGSLAIARRSLTAIDVDKELDRARANLSNIPITELTSKGTATLDNIISQLIAEHDILYLICHGSIVNGEPWLWLEDEQGQIRRESGNTLVARLKTVTNRPRLVVLASCQSGELVTADDDTFVALGPRLAEAGIPSVLAMQGSISVDTLAKFMPVFFKEFHNNGQIDRAVACARNMVLDRSDWWMPVLFMRLKTGQIWFSPRFADDKRGRGGEKWPALIQTIQDGEFTPILGPDMAESLFGSRHDLAWRLSTEYEYPMDPHDREGFPQVAQFLAIDLSPSFLPSRLVQYLVQGIQDRHDSLPREFSASITKQHARDEMLKLLDELLTQAWKQRQVKYPAEPHRLLAELSFPVYITADQTNLLTTALRDMGKEPKILLCPWNDRIARTPRLHELTEDPDVDHPLVYHLFGNLREPDSLVLTEDDFFDYLIGVTSNSDKIPPFILERLADTSLLLLGFRMDDWFFRVFFRVLMNQRGGARRNRYAHVAVQLAPEEDRISEPRRARQFLEEYFRSADINIYWGSAEDFSEELRQHWTGKSR